MTPNMALRIDATMDDVLTVIAEHGYATTGMIVDETGYSRPTVSKRLDKLFAAEYIEYVHEPTALWRLVADPRETETGDATTPAFLDPEGADVTEFIESIPEEKKEDIIDSVEAVESSRSFSIREAVEAGKIILVTDELPDGEAEDESNE
jgi:DNA-binding MarR family transcriptional regulator